MKRANWFHGRFSGPLDDGLSCVVTETGTKLTVHHSGLTGDGTWSICIRPERIAVAGPETGDAASGKNLLPGRVVDVVNMGAEFHYIVEGAEGRVIVVEPNRAGPRVHSGDLVSLVFRADDCIVLRKEEN